MKIKYRTIIKSVSLIASYSLMFFASCESTAQSNSQSEEINPTEIALAKEGSESASSLKKLINDCSLTVSKIPQTPYAENAFTSEFEVTVLDKKSLPVNNFTICVTYPVEKTDEGYNFSTAEIITGENGTAVFKPEEIYKTSILSEITFSPSAKGNTNLSKICTEKAVSVPFRVKFNFQKYKGVHLVDLVDFDEQGRMILNSALSTSSNLMSEIWKASGVPYSAQNFDCHDAVKSDDPEKILAKVRSLIGKNSYFKDISYGKVEYVSPVEKTDDGYSVTLKVTVKVMNLSTGTVFHTMTKTATAVKANQWEVLKACQTELSKQIAQDLICIY